MIKIVLADDNDLDRSMTTRAIRQALPEAFIDAHECGESALVTFDTEPTPALILLDHRMPNGGAEDFLRLAAARLDDIPIVIFSSAVSPTNVARCIELGAREYVEKPTDPTDYRTTVQAILHRYLSSD